MVETFSESSDDVVVEYVRKVLAKGQKKRKRKEKPQPAAEDSASIAGPSGPPKRHRPADDKEISEAVRPLRRVKTKNHQMRKERRGKLAGGSAGASSSRH